MNLGAKGTTLLNEAAVPQLGLCPEPLDARKPLSC
jgi:hypothetical protein